MDGTPEGGWYPGARITAAEALAAFTSTPAAVHRAHDLGTITQGKRADLAVLSNNILGDELAPGIQTKVEMTLFDGRIVHRLL